eukprot:26505_5
MESMLIKIEDDSRSEKMVFVFYRPSGEALLFLVECCLHFPFFYFYFSFPYFFFTSDRIRLLSAHEILQYHYLKTASPQSPPLLV